MALKQPQKEEYTVHDVQDALDSLLAKGLIVKTNRMRDGLPIYVATEWATPEESSTQRQRRCGTAAIDGDKPTMIATTLP